MKIDLSYNSSGLSFSEWISLFTLCLAPLLAHVLSGAPPPRYLTETPLKWHERLGHYNPTSVVWRYIVIADRRIRALSWNAADMAATNALFWTDKGWDGSESMTFRAIPYATRLPDSGRIQFLSGEMLKTIVIALQGAQGIFLVAIGAFPDPTGKYSGQNQVTLDSLFAPLAILGLVRLSAALFLTEDFNFMLHSGFEIRASPNEAVSADTEKSRVSNILLHRTTEDDTVKRFRRVYFWASMLFKLSCLAFLLLLFGTTVYAVVMTESTNATTFAYNVFYLILVGPTFLICLYYFYFRAETTTIIPCISSLWYKLYTLFVALSMLLLIVIAAIEVRRTPCGIYTSVASTYGLDGSICSAGTSYINFRPANQYYTGVVGTYSDSGLNLLQFTGTCFGPRSRNATWVNETCGVSSD